MATKREVHEKLRELIGRLDAAGGDVQGTLAENLPERKVIDVYVTDLDEHFWTEMAGGKMGELRDGRPATTDIGVRLSSDALIDLVDGRTSLFSQYLSGKVRIDASVGDLLRLRKLAG